MKTNLTVRIGKLKLKNPVLTASGTFGYAEEFKDFIDLRQLGAIVTKTVTLNPRKGNLPARTCETPSGMLNSIGLENPGIEVFLKEKLVSLSKIRVPIIVSIASENDPAEFPLLAKRLDGVNSVVAIELNISCPNMGHRLLVSQDPKATHSVVKSVRKVTGKTLITKLSPNVTDIVQIALAAESAGTDALSLVNTLNGMSVDVKSRLPKIAAGSAGLSGPAIRPVAVKMVWDVYRKIKVPIIGMGGIIDVNSALEFFISGATAVSIGTANFINPATTLEVIRGLKIYLAQNKIKDIRKLTGSIKIEP
ncbi:MAG: dihydroorotate dehydrogenase [Deltaproteobacteria bacterium]